MLHLFNTRTNKKEPFKPLDGNTVGLYTCGPTVYNYAHIGNLRTYVFEDVLRRILRMAGYKVQHVMNITDVGHLTDDGDAGEDKMEKGALREGKTAWDIAEFYTDAFKNDLADLNILEPSVWCKATDHIPEQIALVETLTEKGYTYQTSDGIYFDTTKLSDYGKLVNLQAQKLQAGARVEMGEKKHPHDFALWKFSKEGEQRQMEWDAFLRKGFPGWHIECSAMSMKYLGNQFDIHCGGVDHKPVHHTNEIAQSEAATGKKPWVNFWLHGEFLLIDAGKMAKSGENFITLSTLKDNGYDPLAYRYFILQAHYRKQLNFSWDALDAAAAGLQHLRKSVASIDETVVTDLQVLSQIREALEDDMNTAMALAHLSTALKQKNIEKKDVIEIDKVLGLKLHNPATPTVAITAELQRLLDARAIARKEKNWEESDRLREAITEAGYTVEDTADGQHITHAS